MSVELLYTVIAICLVIITASIVFLTHIVYTSVQKINVTLDLIADTSRDVHAVKNGLRSVVLRLASSYIEKLQGGER